MCVCVCNIKTTSLARSDEETHIHTGRSDGRTAPDIVGDDISARDRRIPKASKRRASTDVHCKWSVQLLPLSAIFKSTDNSSQTFINDRSRHYNQSLTTRSLLCWPDLLDSLSLHFAQLTLSHSFSLCPILHCSLSLSVCLSQFFSFCLFTHSLIQTHTQVDSGDVSKNKIKHCESWWNRFVYIRVYVRACVCIQVKIALPSLHAVNQKSIYRKLLWFGLGFSFWIFMRDVIWHRFASLNGIYFQK